MPGEEGIDHSERNLPPLSFRRPRHFRSGRIRSPHFDLIGSATVSDTDLALHRSPQVLVEGKPVDDPERRRTCQLFVGDERYQVPELSNSTAVVGEDTLHLLMPQYAFQAASDAFEADLLIAFGALNARFFRGFLQRCRLLGHPSGLRDADRRRATERCRDEQRVSWTTTRRSPIHPSLCMDANG